ncbi:MAG TPA: glycosyltransferase, partial [Thermoanaerobaculia bacterium]|nr:glycosyltransferase [Thermoanaerobaculia bacterium]
MLDDLKPGPARDATRVVHVSSVHPALDGRVFYREAMSLKRLGYEVTVFGGIERETEVHGVRVKPFPPSGNRFLRLLTSWWRGLRIVRETEGDIYHFHDPELLVAGALARMLWKKRVVFDAHEDPNLVRLKPYIPRPLRTIAAGASVVADRFLSSRFDGVVTATERLEEKYRGVVRRCVTFHNFPAPLFLEERDRAFIPWAERRAEVVHLGTASLHRLPLILSVARAFLRAKPEWTFRLFGLSPAQMAACKELLPDSCDGRLIIQGLLGHEAVSSVLCSAQLGFNFHYLHYEQVR